MIRAHRPAGSRPRPVDYRAAVPRADFDVEAAVPAVHAICEAVRTRGVDAIREYVRAVRRRRPSTTSGSAPEAMRRALDELDPSVRAGAGGVDPPPARDLRQRARAGRGHRPGARRPGHPPQGAGRPRRPLRPRRPGAAGLQRADERRPGAERRRRLDRAGLPAAEGVRRAVHPTILAACALLGVDEVYAVGGAQAIAMFAYGTGPCAQVDLVTGPGNIYMVAAKRLLKGLVGIDSEAGPTEIAILADDTADAAYVAADLISQAEHDPLAASVLVTDRRSGWPTTWRPSWTSRSRRPSTSSGSAPRCRAVSPASCWSSDLEQGLGRGRRLRRRAPRDPHRGRRGVAARVRNAGAIFVGPYAPVCLGDYCAGSNHVLPTGGCACHSSGLSVRAFTKSVHVVDYSRERARARSPTTSSTLAERRGPARVTARRSSVAIRRAEVGDRRAGPRSGRSCGASSPTARRSWTCPCSSTPTRTPTAPSDACADDIAAAVRAAATTLNRYPDREHVELRTALAAYLSQDTPHGVSADQVWAANGSNEVMLQLLQAFGGPGRTAMSFAPTYSMYPEYARDTSTAWVQGRAGRGLRPRPRRRARGDRERAAQRRAAAEPEQPDRHRAAARGRRGCCARPRARRDRRRRRGLRRVPARRASRARWSCCPSTATWWSPAR